MNSPNPNRDSMHPVRLIVGIVSLVVLVGILVVLAVLGWSMISYVINHGFSAYDLACPFAGFVIFGVMGVVCLFVAAKMLLRV